MTQRNADICKIKVLEKDYAINCAPDEREMLKKSATFLNEKIKETRNSGGVSGGEKILVMTALNMIYDFMTEEEKAKNDNTDNTKSVKKLQQLNNKIEAALHKHQQIELT